jgi:hypothetical protein
MCYRHLPRSALTFSCAAFRLPMSLVFRRPPKPQAPPVSCPKRLSRVRGRVDVEEPGDLARSIESPWNSVFLQNLVQTARIDSEK